jgi:hypothetical protein
MRHNSSTWHTPAAKETRSSGDGEHLHEEKKGV